MSRWITSSPADPKLRGRLLIGAIAGIAGALAVTVAINELHRRRPRRERHPRPPTTDLDTASQFACGAACGALISVASVRISPITGAMAGIGVWTASTLGWLPGAGLLKPATLHPKRRNALMIGAHLIWGVATARAMRELVEAREDVLESNEDGVG